MGTTLGEPSVHTYARRAGIFDFKSSCAAGCCNRDRSPCFTGMIYLLRLFMRWGFSIFQRPFNRNLFAVRIDPMKIKGGIGRDEYQARSCALASCPMHVTRRHVDEIAAMRDQSFLALHLYFKRTAGHHHCFRRSMPMPRGHASRSELGENDRSPFAGIAFFNRYRKAFRRIWYRAKFGARRRVHNCFVPSVLSGEMAEAEDQNTRGSHNRQK